MNPDKLLRFGEAERRSVLQQRFPDSYVDPDTGDVVERRTAATKRDDEGTIQEWTNYMMNLSALFRSARRTTADPELLLIEAQLVDEGRAGNNPAVPIDDKVERAARELIAREDLEPAWEVDDG